MSNQLEAFLNPVEMRFKEIMLQIPMLTGIAGEWKQKGWGQANRCDTRDKLCRFCDPVKENILFKPGHLNAEIAHLWLENKLIREHCLEAISKVVIETHASVKTAECY